MKGSLKTIAFLDSNGAIIASPTEVWRDETKESRERSRTPTRNTLSGGIGNVAGSADGASCSDTQLAVMVSEKQARLISLPSQTCVFRAILAPENTFVVTASVIHFKGTWFTVIVGFHQVTRFSCFPQKDLA